MTSRPTSSRRIAIIAPTRYPICEPFAGGLQAHVWTLTKSLHDRGHRVTLFATPGSDAGLPIENLGTECLALSEHARHDVSMPPEVVMAEHHAYLSLMLRLGREADRWDVIHNHSLHHLPIAMAAAVDVPMVTTLHTPPTPWLESAVQAGPRPPIRFVAVSEFTASAWRPLLGAVDVVPNGIDVSRWRFGAGGHALAWSGRMVAEKAPHVAIDAARLAGRPIRLAGPISDPVYFANEVAPRLGDDARWVGHLDQARLSHLIRRSSALVVTPDWDEPYGLVVAEALASGTPVAAFARGGIPEIVDRTCARLVTPGDVDALARAIIEAEQLNRRLARLRAERHCGVELMVDRYEEFLVDAVAA